MRAAVLVSIVLFACDHAAGPAPFDDDLPARLDCTSAGTFAPGGGHSAWRGTLDTTAGVLDVAAGPLHTDAPFPGEVDYPALRAEGSLAWDGSEGALHFEGEALAFTLERLADVKGFVVGGPVDLGQDGPVDVWCWNPDIQPGFAYEPDDGVCRDAEGTVGTEPRPVQMIRETGDGQCADLRGVALDEGEYAYQTWTGFDLRGANLEGASMHFANLFDAALEGARMQTFDFGYAEITGTIDAHTTLPAEGCEATYLQIDCFR